MSIIYENEKRGKKFIVSAEAAKHNLVELDGDTLKYKGIFHFKFGTSPSSSLCHRKAHPHPVIARHVSAETILPQLSS